MNYYERAKELREETVANRRYLHTNAEVGLNMPKAQAFVMGKLKEYGLEPKECGHGVTATLGKGGKVLHFRCRKRVWNLLHVLPVSKHMREDTISMQQCF